MGNDGGSIPTRRELVKEAARNPTTAELKESQQEQQEYQWTHDPVSREPLSQPVVSDSSGKLYNKDTILEYLVSGTRGEEIERIVQGRIQSVKDVVEVMFQVDQKETAHSSGDGRSQVWRCPVTGDKLGPGSKAVYIVPCGHAFSGTAIKEVSGEKCLTCEAEYASNDIIPILPFAATDVARLSLRVKTLQEKGLAHSLKKAAGASKKRKKKDNIEQPVANGKEPPVKTSTGVKSGTDYGAINNTSTASLTAKVMEEQDRTKKRKVENQNVRSLFSSRDQSKPIGKSNDFMSRGYSVNRSFYLKDEWLLEADRASSPHSDFNGAKSTALMQIEHKDGLHSRSCPSTCKLLQEHRDMMQSCAAQMQFHCFDAHNSPARFPMTRTQRSQDETGGATHARSSGKPTSCFWIDDSIVIWQRMESRWTAMKAASRSRIKVLHGRCLSHSFEYQTPRFNICKSDINHCPLNRSCDSAFARLARLRILKAYHVPVDRIELSYDHYQYVLTQAQQHRFTCGRYSRTALVAVD
nr:replication termination factor 2 [Quercus suber]